MPGKDTCWTRRILKCSAVTTAYSLIKVGVSSRVTGKMWCAPRLTSSARKALGGDTQSPPSNHAQLITEMPACFDSYTKLQNIPCPKFLTKMKENPRMWFYKYISPEHPGQLRGPRVRRGAGQHPEPQPARNGRRCVPSPPWRLSGRSPRPGPIGPGVASGSRDDCAAQYAQYLPPFRTMVGRRHCCGAGLRSFRGSVFLVAGMHFKGLSTGAFPFVPDPSTDCSVGLE